jgi:hypothetical protein
MYTYSLYNSTTYQSTSLSLSGTPSYFQDILDTLPDNLQKIISPKDLRDMTLSLWSDVIFKETSASGSTIGYIGIDTGNPTSSDVKNKIYVGKRYFSGTYSPNDAYAIIATASLNSDLDLFFYNTKSDLVDNDTTRIAILAGTALSNFENMPYIQSQFVTGVTDSLSIDFVNPIGDVNVTNVYGDINIAGLSGSATVSFAFPTPSESSASASNNKVLKYDESTKKLYWDDIIFPTLNTVGTTGSALQMFGNPFLVNNSSIELYDTRRVPINIGDITYGATFGNMAVSEVLRRVIYDYLPPTCSAQLLAPYSSGYVEVGTYPTPTVEFTINKKTLPTIATTLTNMIPGVYGAVTTPQYSSVTSTSNGIVISPITASTTTFTVQVSDGTGIGTASTTITGVYPYFYGFSSLSTMTTVGLGSLTKKVESFSDKIYDYVGSGNMYFIYPKDYGTLSNIYDSFGNTCSASFSNFSSPTSQIFSSPTGLWASEEFWVYQWNGAPVISLPSQNFEFRY